jgi:hypothetical protein
VRTLRSSSAVERVAVTHRRRRFESSLRGERDQRGRRRSGCGPTETTEDEGTGPSEASPSGPSTDGPDVARDLGALSATARHASEVQRKRKEPAYRLTHPK